MYLFHTKSVTDLLEGSETSCLKEFLPNANHTRQYIKGNPELCSCQTMITKKMSTPYPCFLRYFCLFGSLLSTP